MYILKNVVRNGPKGSHTLCSRMSTYVDILNDECAKEQLQALHSPLSRLVPTPYAYSSDCSLFTHCSITTSAFSFKIKLNT